ncbi:MAG: peptidase [Acidobacteria bacterium]|nr:peptidase [Acidobacteriota bacterium]
MPSGPLPLFPLPLVLMPGALLPLHIFEPRYRRLVGGAAEDGSEFGILLTHDGRVEDGSIESAGCTAVVEQVTKRYDDGRFDVTVRGVRRFRTLELDRSEECLRAHVEYFDDEPDLPLEPAEKSRLRAVAMDAARLAGASVEQRFDPAEPNPSFSLAAELPLDVGFKQQLLELRSERRRAAALEAYLLAWIQRTDAARRARGVAGSNGHARPV